MADNTQLNPGVAGDLVVTREVTHAGDTAKLQGVFMMGISGVEGAYTAAALGGDATNGLDVDVTRLPVLPAGDNNIGNVDLASAIPAGDNNIGNVDLASAIPAGTNNIGDVDVLTLPSLPAGTNNIGDVDLASPLPAGTNNIGDVDVLTLPTLPAGDNNIGNVDIVTLPVLPTGDNNIGNVDVLTLPSIPAGVNNIGDVDIASIAAGNNNIGDVDIATIAAGDNNIGNVDIASAIPAGDNNIGNVDIVTLPALPAGNNNIGDVDVLSLVPGTGATALGKAADAVAGATDTGVAVLAIRDDSLSALVPIEGDYVPLRVSSTGALHVTGGGGGTQFAEDAAHASGDVGTMVLAVRRDTGSTLAGTDNDYAPLQLDASGNLRVNVAAGAATAQVDDAAFTPATSEGVNFFAAFDDTAPDNVDEGDAGVLRMSANRSLYTTLRDAAGNERGANIDASNRLTVAATVIAALPAGTANIGDVDVLTLPSIPAGTNNIGDVDVMSIAAGDNNIGNVDVVTLPALPSGTNNIGDVDVLTLPTFPAGDNNIGNVDIVTMPNVTLAAGTNTNEVVGDAAHDAAIAGNPVRVAGRAMSADFTAVATGDTADLLATLLGKQVVVPYALPGATWSYASPAAVTDTADDVAQAAGAAGVRHYITGVQVFNGHDTVGTEVVIKDGATVLWRGWAEQTGGGCAAKFDPPLRGTAATAVNVANITNASSTYFNLQGYSAAE